MSATLSTSMPAPCPPLCRPQCPPQCRPPQCRLDALWGLRDADRMKIQKYHGGTYLLYTDGLTGVCARDACAFKHTKTQVSYQTAFVCKWLSAIFCSLASQLPMDCIDPPTDIFLREPFIAIIWIVIIIISIIRCHGNICKKTDYHIRYCQGPSYLMKETVEHANTSGRQFSCAFVLFLALAYRHQRWWILVGIMQMRAKKRSR